MATRLGLDLGPNSIGWALLDDETILGAGVRVFKEGLDNFDTGKETSLNEQRRAARMGRRQTRRRTQRRDQLQAALIEAGLFPKDPEEQMELYVQDPYLLRAQGLDEELHPYQFGRIILHLSRHRGFWSPRKGAAKKEDGDILKEISELEAAVQEAGCRTLGEYLCQKHNEQDPMHRMENDHVRDRHTRRAMLEKEFLTLWEKQAEYYPKLLTEKRCFGEAGRQAYPRKPIPRHHFHENGESQLKAFGVHGVTFFQRPIYWPTSSIGLCELEPKQRRYPKAHRLTEWCRLLQEVNNIRYVDSTTGEICGLTQEQRQKIRGFLATREKVAFKQIRKELGLPEETRFNLEEGKRSGLKGMTTDYRIAKAIGKAWHKRPEDEKNQIVEILLAPDLDEESLLRQLMNEFGFDEPTAEALLGVDLPAGYGSLSLKALKKLIPFLEQGMIYMGEDESNSAMHAAGYLRRDQLQRRIFDQLPHPDRMKDCPIGDIPNPVVKRTLMQLRKVVNAIIREYGKPDAIHVEMARELQIGKKKRTERIFNMREREKRRDEAAQELRRQKKVVTRDAILRLLLWDQQDHECMYCGRPISQSQLFSGEADIDHILPISLSHDDSQSNKVICHRKCNHDKDQRTVYEWLADTDPERCEQIGQRAKSLLSRDLMSYPKYKKLLQKHVDSEGFLARQLVDTGYIAKAAAEYLRCLMGEDHHVLGLKGQYTAALRNEWGLNTLLSEMEDSPAWAEEAKLHAGEKNRADHRHHTIDAIVLALTDRRMLQTLSGVLKDRQYENVRTSLPAPWKDFRESVRRAVEPICVSNQVNRGLSGSLHEDTFYGPIYENNEQVEGRFVVRKPLASLTLNEISQIRDEAIKKQVVGALASAGIDIGRGQKPSNEQKKQIQELLGNMTMPSGVPIKKVRIFKNDQTIQPIREGKSGEVWVKPGNTHHLCIFEWEDKKGKKKRDAVFVTMLEAKKRKKNGARLIQRTPPENHPTIPADAKFVMSLSKGEMVLATLADGRQQLWVFNTVASTTGQMAFVLHTDARRSSGQKKITKYVNGLYARKVTVDPLGRIRWAND